MKIKKTVKEYYDNLDGFDNMDELAEGIAQHITMQADKDRVALEETGDFYEWLYEVYELPNHLQEFIPWDWDWFGHFTNGMFEVFFQSRLRETVVESAHYGTLNSMIVEDITDKAHQDGVGVIDTKEFHSWFNNEYEMSPEVEMMIPKNIKYDIRFYEVGVPEVIFYDNGVVLETLKSLVPEPTQEVDPEDLPRALRRYAHMIAYFDYWSDENQFDIWLKDEYDNGNRGKQIFGYGVRDTARQLREDVIKLDIDNMSDDELREYELGHLIDDDEDEIGSSSLYEYRM